MYLFFLPTPCCCCCSVVQSCPTLCRPPWTVACLASLYLTTSQTLLKFMSIESVILSNRLIFCPPLLLLPSIFPSFGVFSGESALYLRWLKNWSFSISPSNEYSGLISFRIDWFDLLFVQGAQESSAAPRFENISSLGLHELQDARLHYLSEFAQTHVH